MLFYRVANHETQQGLWYDYKGNFTGLIHDKFNFCTNNKLPMPYDPNIVGWLSAAETLDELFNWFTPNDIKELEKHGYRIAIYEAYEYKRYNNHWVIKQNNSRLVICVSLIKHNGWRYGLVKADHYRPIKDKNLNQPLLTIPLVIHWRFNTKNYGNSRF